MHTGGVTLLEVGDRACPASQEIGMGYSGVRVVTSFPLSLGSLKKISMRTWC